MDYDDNDFQGQNLNLAGEGSVNLAPVLRPYAAPKFDFDESLQGHLRFDSLVENEVFLGIPSQEDNQWIEEFSQGSSGIELDSSATESCSISRHDNVWSEATSSESVEMLIKSVPCDSSIEGVGTQNPEETNVEVNDRVQHLSGFTDNSSNDRQPSVDSTLPSKCDADDVVQEEGNTAILNKHGCGSPTIISCVELSHNAKDNHEQGKGLMPHSEVTDNVEGKIHSISKNLCENESSNEEMSFTFEVSPSVGLGDVGKVLQSFPTIQSSSLPMIAERSASKSVPGQVDPKMAQEVTHCSPQVPQFEELKTWESVDPDAKKPSGVISIPAENLPDLNTSVSLVQQPFTDVQQVQLRAQILVYGLLVQGTPPAMACRTAAFGSSGQWFEKSLGACLRSSIKRLRRQKSLANKNDTPVRSRSGITTPDQAVKHGSVTSVKSKVPSSTTGRANRKGTVTPSPVINPMIPLSSPLWNISTPSSKSRGAPIENHQTLSPLHPFQTPPMQNFAGHNPSRLSQGHFPGRWVAAPPTFPFNISGRISTSPFTDAVKLTPMKESGYPTVSSVLPVGESKNRKRKKVSTTEPVQQITGPSQTQTKRVDGPPIFIDLSEKVESHRQFSLFSQNRTESASLPVVSSIFSTAVSVLANASFNSKSTPEKSPSPVTPSPSNDQPKIMDQNAKEKIILSVESLNKVEEAKVQAEEAAKHTSSAISHCQDVWSKLEKQKNSGLVSDVEVRLVSAAVSIAAATSVSKAAAAAAKIASNVAEQAKLMVDEVLISSVSRDFSQSCIISFPNASNDYGKSTLASILKGGDGPNHSNSIISAAREASRRRVEATSAASKHAENLDVIVKAAELAAEAVSQAGKIVAMSEPLPLSGLVSSDPESYWKAQQLASEQQGAIQVNMNSHKSNTMNTEEDSNVPARLGPSDMEIKTLKHGTPQENVSGDLIKDPTRVLDDILVSKTSHGKESGGLRARNENKITSGIVEENIIKEGCLVEMVKDVGKFKGAWFAANVLNLKDGKAYLCYRELESYEGKLKEWVALEGDGTKVPKIRIADPMTTMKFEGTRKRRRGAVTDYSLNVGDRVDAWLHICWCEGLITDKNDETSLTVHFPAQGETSVVRAWHLRPTLIWKDEKWIKWSSSKGNHFSQGDTPKEKRMKRGYPLPDLCGKQKLPMAFIPEENQPMRGVHDAEDQERDRTQTSVDHVASGKHEEARLLSLSAHEKVFNVGKTSKVEKKLESHRTVRSGLQKEGPRVIFGVPKPGKKQKFMDVSKHYNGDRGNKNDSSKFTRNMMPQATGPPRGWTNNFKNDNKEKQNTEMKPRVFKSRKATLFPSGRTLVLNDNMLSSAKFAPKETTMAENVVKSSASNDRIESREYNLMVFKSSSNTDDTIKGPMLSDAPKRVFSSKTRFERSNRGGLVPAGGKSTNQEGSDKSGHEVAEPRRSNRRIQPTSRLLEGLQSSLTLTKIPAVSHDKSDRGQNKATPEGK